MFTANWYMHDMGAGAWLIMTLVWALVIGAILWAVLAKHGDGEARQRDRTPRDILEERLARGEISLEEFERLRDALGHDRAPRPGTPVAP